MEIMNPKVIVKSIEKILLATIAVLTIIATVQEIIKIYEIGTVTLADLLLLFIYTEVLGMIGVFYASNRIPITLPLFIAMTAISRLIILQGKGMDASVLLYEAGAILIIAIACLVIRYRPNNQYEYQGEPVIENVNEEDITSNDLESSDLIDVEELEPISKKWLNEQDDLKVLDILRMLQITQNFEKNLKNMIYPRLNLDSILVKLLSLESTVTLTEVIEGKINKKPKDPFLNKENEVSFIKKSDKELDVKNNNRISNNYENGKNEEIKDQNDTLIEDKVVHKSKLDLNFFIRNWNDFLEQIENEHPKYLTYLSDVRLSYFKLGVLGIELNSQSDFSANGIRNNQEKLERIFSEYVGEVINIELEVKNEISEAKSEKQIKDAKGHPLFEKIVDTFDGEIIRS